MWDVVVRALSAVLTMGLPVALFFQLKAKVNATWRLFRIGALTFIASQLVHIPLNTFLLQPLMSVLGLSITSTGLELWIFAITLGTFKRKTEK